MKRAILTFACVAVLANTGFASEDRTAFRGLAIGMSKEAVLSLKVDKFTTKFVPAVTNGTEVFVAARIEFVSPDRTVCADAPLDNLGVTVVRLKLDECFFGSNGADVKVFTQQFVDSYNIGSMSGSYGRVNKAMIEKYVGQTKLGEEVEISTGTGPGFKLPITIRVTAPMSGATFN